MWRTAVALVAICVLSASAEGALSVETAIAANPTYLSPETTPDGVRILPPPPARGSPVAIADRQVFRATRRLRGSLRWRLSTSDAHTEAFEHFGCALGVKLTAQTAPAVARLLDRATTAGVVDPVKEFYHTRRPYLGTGAPICQAKTAALAANGDYPSGHAAGGWMEALILTELAPDRATRILARGRAFGESRVICGAHSLSAVEAGWLAGAAATAALHGSPEFRADLEAARDELARVRMSAPAPDAAACRIEAATLAKPAY
jgi:acid phosphatase (class A)